MRHKFIPRGFYIPAEVFFCSKLTDLQKRLFPIIESLDNDKGCFASNEYLANILEVTQTAISVAVGKLKELGFIREESFDGRRRKLRIDYGYIERYRYETTEDFVRRTEREDHAECSDELPQRLIANNVSYIINNNSGKKIIDKVSSKEDTQKISSSSPTKIVRLSREEKIQLQLELNGSKDYKEKPLPSVPRSIQSLIDTWNNLGLHKHKDPSTKVYQIIVSNLKSLLRGKFFTEEMLANYSNEVSEILDKKFSEEEVTNIFISLKNACSPLYEPTGTFKTYLRTISLPDYLYNPMSKKSFFLEFFFSPPVLLANTVSLVENPNPSITSVFKSFYQRTVLGGVAPSYSIVEENKFSRATQRAMEFLRKYGRRMVSVNGVTDFASLVCNALQESVDDQNTKLEIGHFASDRTWNKVVPSYLQSQAIFGDFN